MTQPKKDSMKEFDDLFRSLNESYQLGELAILHVLASLDSKEPDPPQKLT